MRKIFISIFILNIVFLTNGQNGLERDVFKKLREKNYAVAVEKCSKIWYNEKKMPFTTNIINASKEYLNGNYNSAKRKLIAAKKKLDIYNANKSKEPGDEELFLANRKKNKKKCKGCIKAAYKIYEDLKTKINIAIKYPTLIKQVEELEKDIAKLSELLSKSKNDTTYNALFLLSDTVKYYRAQMIDTLKFFNDTIDNLVVERNSLNNDINDLIDKRLKKKKKYEIICNREKEILINALKNDKENAVKKWKNIYNDFKILQGKNCINKGTFQDTIDYYSYLVKRQDSIINNINISPALKDSVYCELEFELEKYSIEDKHTPKLDTIVKFLKENEKMAVLIAGFADPSGSDLYNLSLSEIRAKSVMLYLHEHGISLNRMNIVGFGEINASRHQNSKIVKIYIF